MKTRAFEKSPKPADTLNPSLRTKHIHPGDTDGPVAGGDEQLSLGQEQPRKVSRGITARVGSWPLRAAITFRALEMVNRFRVIRTIDVAVHCFAERPFKAALSAAQRAMRGMVKAKLVARYRTDRFMTVYGLTQRGAEWLQVHGVEASASVRRVTDMTNPEHRLWSQFLTLCAEARGYQAWTEPELLHMLAQKTPKGQEPPPGLLQVKTVTGGRTRKLCLRPDAAALEDDGLTWFEVDRSARGSDRAASLRALALSIGSNVALNVPLRRVVIHTRTERIHKRVLAGLSALAASTSSTSLVVGRRRLVPRESGIYEVWMTCNEALRDGRVRMVDQLAGFVLVQELPIWLPRVRLDGRGDFSTHGWFKENVLPYMRPAGMPGWESPREIRVTTHSR